MVFRLFFISLSTLICASVHAQCLTDFDKLLPETGVIYGQFAYGSAVSVWDDVVAVGAYKSDTLGYTSAGVVYLYTRKPDGTWSPSGILKPSAPSTDLQFGRSIQVSANYIVVGCGFNKPLYIFRKPAGGWTTTIETALIQPAGSA